MLLHKTILMALTSCFLLPGVAMAQQAPVPKPLGSEKTYEPQTSVYEGFPVLSWPMKSWPKNLDGFIVKRRDKGAGETQWQRLNTELVKPDFTMARALARGHGDVVRRLKSHVIMEKPYSYLLADIAGRAAKRSLAADLSTLAQLRPEDAELFGFAWVDRTALPGHSYAYLVEGQFTGLFEPLRFTYTVDTAEKLIPCLAENLKIEDGLLSWTANIEAMKKAGCNSFLIMYQSGNDPWRRREYPVVTMSEKNGNYEYKKDLWSEQMKAETWIAVAPFYNRGNHSFVGAPSKPLKCEPAPVAINELKIDINAVRQACGDILVEWKFSNLPGMKNFFISAQGRLPDGTNKYIDLEEAAPDLRRAIIRAEKLPPGDWTIWINIHSKDRNTMGASGRAEKDIHVPPLPVEISDLKATRELRDGKVYVRLSWKGPILESLPYKIERKDDDQDWSYAGESIQPEFEELQREGVNGRKLRYRVVGRGEQIVNGPTIEYVATDLLAHQPIASIIEQRKDAILIAWHGDFGSNVKGFRLLAGDKALRTEKELGPDCRLLLLGVNEMRKGYFLNLQTVLDDGKLSPLSDPLKPKFETVVELSGWGKLSEPLKVIREQRWSNDKKQLILDMECVKDEQGQLVPHGRRRTWALNGLPVSDLQYQRGLLDGIQRYFDNFDGGKLMSLCFMLEGKEVSRVDYEKAKGPSELSPEDEKFLKGGK